MPEQLTPPLSFSNQETLNQPDYLRQALLAQPHIEAVQIGFEPRTIVTDGESDLKRTVNDNEGLTQELHAVIDAGGSKFGVLKVSNDSGGEPAFIISKFAVPGNNENRAQVVGVISPDEVTTIGRNYDDDLPQDVSRDHFQVTVLNGKVFIADLNSTNGTEVLVRKGSAEYQNRGLIIPEKTAPKGLSRFIKSRKKAPASSLVLPDPLNEFKTWAPKSSYVKELLVESNVPKDPFATESLVKLLKHRSKTDMMHYEEYKSNKLIHAAQKLAEKSDEKTKAAIYELVSDNSFGGTELTKVFGKWSAGDDFLKAGELIRILDRDPGAARALVENHIGGFHASQSGSLYGVLEHGGLLSAQEARERGQLLSTGEKTYSNKGGQSDISFADWREPESIHSYSQGGGAVTLEGLLEYRTQLVKSIEDDERLYGTGRLIDNAKAILVDTDGQIELLTQRPDSLEAELVSANFPIAYGIDVSAYQEEEYFPRTDEKRQYAKGKLVLKVPSDIPGEFVVCDAYIALSKLPVIAVPADRIEQVKSLLKSHGQKAKVIDISLIAEKPKQYY